MPVGLGAARRLSVVLAALAILGVVPAVAGVRAFAGSGAPVTRVASAGAASTFVAAGTGHAYLGLNSNLRAPSHLSAWAIDRYLTTQTVLPPIGHAFKAAETKYGVNALYLLAHAMHETAFGTSFIAQRYHNLFGWQAFDRDPTRWAMRFPSFAASVDYVAQQIATQYLSPTGKFYGGAATLRGMHYYASDPHWGQAIAGIANSIVLPTLAGLHVTFKTPVAGTLSTGVAGRIAVTSTGPLPNGLRAAYRFVPIAVVEAGAPTGAVPSTDPAFKLASGSSKDGTMKLSVSGPTRPGRYRLELELRDSDGTELTEGGVPAIPDASVRVYGTDAVTYDLKQTSKGLSVRVTNVGRRDIAAIAAPGPKSGLTAATPTTLTAWLIDASGAPVVLGRVSPSHVIKAGGTWQVDFAAPDPGLLPAMLLVRMAVAGDPARLGGSPPGVYRLSLTDPPSIADGTDGTGTSAPNVLPGAASLPGAQPDPSGPPASPSPTTPTPPVAATGPLAADAGLDITGVTPVDAATRLLLDPGWKPGQVQKPNIAKTTASGPLKLGYLALVNPKLAGAATLRITNLGSVALPGPANVAASVPLPSGPNAAAAIAGALGSVGAAPQVVPGAMLAVTAVPAWGPATSPISFRVPLPAGIGVGKALDLPISLPAQSAGQSTFLVTARVIATDGRTASLTVFWLRSALPTLRATTGIVTKGGATGGPSTPPGASAAPGNPPARPSASSAATGASASAAGGAALPGSIPAPESPPQANTTPTPSQPAPAPPPTEGTGLWPFGPPAPVPSARTGTHIAH